mmetsp:Transcript_23311/g.35449  ORF Transcript_23311/g.35449 Transcript_23311/m.35449 type:complete len:145 (-) Transcript_23311:1056-1490(-)
MGLSGKSKSDVEQPFVITDAHIVQVSPTAPTAPTSPNTTYTSSYANENGTVASPSTILLTHFSRNPMKIDPCPLCGQRTKTRVVSSPNWLTWVTAVGVGIFCFPLFWVPLVMESCKRTEHFCTKCQNYLGEAKPFSDCCVSRRG